MTSVRIFFIGGLMSFRALFNWMNTWIFVPTTLLPVWVLVVAVFVRTESGEPDDVLRTSAMD